VRVDQSATLQNLTEGDEGPTAVSPDRFFDDLQVKHAVAEQTRQERSCVEFGLLVTAPG